MNILRISKQKNNETLISRNIDKILNCYLEDHFSKDVIDFFKKNNIDSKSGTLQDALKEYAIKDPNGYYHYYKDGYHRNRKVESFFYLIVP